MTEYLAENSRLRQLSRRYAEGQLDFADYRGARREIIAALESGQVQTAAAPLQDHEASAVTGETPRVLADDDGVFLKTMPPQVALTEAAAPVTAAQWDGNTRVLAAVLVAAAVLALGALFWVLAL